MGAGEIVQGKNPPIEKTPCESFIQNFSRFSFFSKDLCGIFSRFLWPTLPELSFNLSAL